MPFKRQPFTGFPFDDQRLSGSQSDQSSSSQPPSGATAHQAFGSRGDDTRLHFDDHLRDIAARYPEFAEHIRPRGGATFGRERVRRDPWPRHDEFDFGREFDSRPEFEGRFARPREFYPPNTQTYTNPPESRPPAHPQTPPPTAPKPAHTQTAAPGIHQSNTVDLGQVQPPSGQAGGGVGECRGQRSMSAPPTDGGRATAGTGKRYVTSIQIPVLQQATPQGTPTNTQLGGAKQSADMGASNVTPKTPPQHRPNEYVIPIHIEGRDEPITPKQHPPNTEHNTQPPSSGQQRPLFNAMKDQFKPQQQQQTLHNEQKDSEQPERAPPAKPSPLELIQLIQKDVSALMGRVDKYAGRPRDKEYIYLDEMLTRNLLKLDNIETDGQDVIRCARRETIRCIEGCIGILEAKARANAAAMEAGEGQEKEGASGDGGEAQECAVAAAQIQGSSGGEGEKATADVAVT